MRGFALRSLVAHPVIRNATALYTVQAAGAILPLVTLPYLSRVLGPRPWGYVLIAQGFASVVALFVEYGFNISATRAIAGCRREPERVARTVSDIYAARAVLLLPAVMAGAAAASRMPAFRQEPRFLIGVALQIGAQGFSPFWYFQGTERMGRAVGVELAARVLGTAAIFLLVHDPADMWRVSAIQGGAGACSTLLPTVWMYRETGWRLPHLGRAGAALRAGFGPFFFRLSTSTSTTANALVLGVLATPLAVGMFGGAERMVLVLLSGFAPLSQALYPRMSHLMASDPRGARRLARLTVMAVVGISCSLAVATWLSAPWLIQKALGPQFTGAVPVFRVLLTLLPLRAVNNVLGLQWLLASGRDSAVAWTTAAAGVTSLALALLLAPGNGALGMSWAVCAAECVALAGFVAAILRPVRHGRGEVVIDEPID